MSIRPLPVPRQGIQTAKWILDRPLSEVQAIALAIVESRPSADLQAFSEGLAGASGQELHEVERLVQMLIALAMRMHQDGTESLDVLLGVGTFIESQVGQSDWHAPAWEERVQSLQMCLDEGSPIRLMAKGIELSEDFPAILIGTKCVTDLRFVFDAGGEATQAFVVAHSLLLQCREADGSIVDRHVRLDVDDIKTLIKQLTRSLVKHRTVVNTCSSQSMIDLSPTLGPVGGEE